MKTKLYIANITKLNEQERFNNALALVSDACLDKISKIKFPKDKNRSLLAELLLIKALNDEGLFQLDTEYEYHHNGKPYLKNYPDVFFNKSHSNNLVICGISSKEIGCDIEMIKHKDLKIAQRFFAKNEYNRILLENNEDNRLDLFFRFWTLKESFLKITGQGMKLSMDSFTIAIDGKYPQVTCDKNFNKCYFREIEVDERYKCSVCGYDESINTEDGIEIQFIDVDELLVKGNRK